MFKFEGIDDIGSAEDFVGCWIVLPAEQAEKLPESTYFDHDLIGCRVQDTQGNELGTVSEILRIAGNNQLIVKDLDREYMIPAVKSICLRVDVDNKQIIVDPPEGLMDLGE